MKLSDFDYELPESLIAQYPLTKRDHSRLLVTDFLNHTLSDEHFYQLPEHLVAGDVLVINDTKVIPARLFGIKPATGAHVELLILNMDDPSHVECLVGNAKVVREGTELSFGDGRLKAICTGSSAGGIRIFKMIFSGIFLEVLEALGETPLPPYIRVHLDDPERYQTVYAKVAGSAAAPTAGLHFTPALLAQLEAMGVIIAHVTLHVGLGTFRPVKTDIVEEHHMHAEAYWMNETTAEILNCAKAQKRRIICVGTTSIRTLESVMQQYGRFVACHGRTEIFIYPGYQFLAADALITNFHLPKSTLMMLVSAFAGRSFIMEAYRHAVSAGYRFFSFGDAMFLVRGDRHEQSRETA